MKGRILVDFEIEFLLLGKLFIYLILILFRSEELNLLSLISCSSSCIYFLEAIFKSNYIFFSSIKLPLEHIDWFVMSRYVPSKLFTDGIVASLFFSGLERNYSFDKELKDFEVSC